MILYQITSTYNEIPLNKHVYTWKLMHLLYRIYFYINGDYKWKSLAVWEKKSVQRKIYLCRKCLFIYRLLFESIFWEKKMQIYRNKHYFTILYEMILWFFNIGQTKLAIFSHRRIYLNPPHACSKRSWSICLLLMSF